MTLDGIQLWIYILNFKRMLLRNPISAEANNQLARATSHPHPNSSTPLATVQPSYLHGNKNLCLSNNWNWVDHRLPFPETGVQSCWVFKCHPTVEAATWWCRPLHRSHHQTDRQTDMLARTETCLQSHHTVQVMPNCSWICSDFRCWSSLWIFSLDDW